MSRDAALVTKLKECIQETVVFLRTLGLHKIPAVVERRRKELLTKLEDAQGDTRREKPPKFEDSPEKDVATPPVVKKQKEKDEELEKSRSESTGASVMSPNRAKRDSKAVNSLVSGFETLHATAKKEEEDETPKKQWQVPLKKVPKPTDYPGGDKEQDSKADDDQTDLAEESSKPEPEEEKPSNQPEPEEEKSSNQLEPGERKNSTLSLDSTGSNEPEAKVVKSKEKKQHKLGALFSKIKGGRDKSPGPSRNETPVPNDEPTEADEQEGVEPELTEEGVRVCGRLEYKVKQRLSSKFVNKEVKLKETTLYIGDKDTVALLGCTVHGNDTGFDLFSHSTQKSHTFRVSEGEEAKEKWVTAIQAAIDEVTPKEEDPTESTSADTVPAIQISEPAPTSNDKLSEAPKKRESKTLEVKKPVKNLPTQEVIKGYIYRKKAGIGNRWEKTFCVVTHSALYFTEVEGNSEYEHMFRVVTGEASFSEKDKGHDKNSKSIVIKMGKKTEQLSIDKKEFANWWTVLQQAYCFGESLEFDEDEELIEEEPIDEDLYEDVASASVPPVPSSPRPQRPPLPEVLPEDDIIIDEDIYEDTDDLIPGREPSEYQEPVISASVPKLPDRNPAPQPKLPPRNAPPVQPTLPPRNAGPPLPSRGSLPAKPPAPIPPTSAEDEELYDDVVIHDNHDSDENYDDVVVGGDDDTYDDVVAREPITEEFYEDMAPGQEDGPQEDYVVMEHGNGEDDDDGELYVDVEHEASPIQAAPIPTPPISSSPKPKPSSTFSKMFAGRKTSTIQTVHSGQVTYRAPKKTKFEARFATVEDTYLLVYKSSSEKKHQEKIALTESALELGSTEAGAGEFCLRVTKGGKVHHFGFTSQKEMGGWVEVLKKLVKYAPVTPGEQQVFQATQDHIAESSEEITFKKGSFIRLISKDNEAIWYGQLGNEAMIFDGKIGEFPAEKVIMVEDMYI